MDLGIESLRDTNVRLWRVKCSLSGCANNFSSQRSQHIHLLHAHFLRHDDDAAVTLYCCRQSQAHSYSKIQVTSHKCMYKNVVSKLFISLQYVCTPNHLFSYHGIQTVISIVGLATMARKKYLVEKGFNL